MEHRSGVGCVYVDYATNRRRRFVQAAREGRPRLSGEELLAAVPTFLGIVVFSLGWAMAWTKYLKKSV